MHVVLLCSGKILHTARMEFGVPAVGDIIRIPNDDIKYVVTSRVWSFKFEDVTLHIEPVNYAEPGE